MNGTSTIRLISRSPRALPGGGKSHDELSSDIDNPPPKVVQGYKMTIFLPDLIDKTKAPTFNITKEPGNDDTCTLVFKCGPPYEDLAFRIVNKEWE